MNWFYVLRTSINRQTFCHFSYWFWKIIYFVIVYLCERYTWPFSAFWLSADIKLLLRHQNERSAYKPQNKYFGHLVEGCYYKADVWFFVCIYCCFFMSDCFVIDFWLIVPKLKCNLTPFTHYNTFISYHTYVSVYVNYKDFILFTIIFTRQSSTLKDVCKKNLIKIRQNWMDILLLVNMVMQPMYYVVILTAMFLS